MERRCAAMIAELGAFMATLALVLSVTQGILGLSASRRDSHVAATRAVSLATAALAALLFACLVAAFVRSDFSMAVVAANSHIDKPFIYKIAGAWENHEGSRRANGLDRKSV
jgi:cytochrome c-type biogenesis protein CcmF